MDDYPYENGGGLKWITKQVEENRAVIKELEAKYFDLHLTLQEIKGNTQTIKAWMEARTAHEVRVSNETVKGRWGLIIAIATGAITLLSAFIGGIFLLLRNVG